MEKVLIALDDTECSRAAFDWFLKELYVPGTAVILVHCIDTPCMPTRDTFEHQTAAGKEKGLGLERHYTTELRKLGVTTKFVMTDERPQKFITQTAKAENVDLVVVGCGGKCSLSRIILGSVSQYVLNHAHCAVAICKNGTGIGDENPDSPKC